MRLKKNAVAKVRGRKPKPAIPLSVMKAKVLKTLAKLGKQGNQAFGYEVVRVLFNETKEWIDPSQVYGIIRELDGDGLIEDTGVSVTSGRGPPMKIFRVTPAGHAALKATAAFHRAHADYLD